MKHLGYLRNKKTVTKLYVDSLANPQLIFYGRRRFANAGALYLPGVSEMDVRKEIQKTYFTKHVQLFQMRFNIDSFIPSASGGFFEIEDIDTNGFYRVYNDDLEYLVKCMQKGDSEYLSSKDGVLEGIFAAQSKGDIVSMRLLKNGELNYLETEW